MFELKITVTIEPNEAGFAGETSVRTQLTYDGKVEKDDTEKYSHVLLAYKQTGDFFYDMIEEIVAKEKGLSMLANLLNLEQTGDKPQLN